jgi:spore coat polysaccharide biosynthesis protein SpsF
MIQARVDSSRLANKVLETIEGKSLLWHVINRAKQVKNVDQVILITTRHKIDEKIIRIANESQILSFQGDTLDVLNRHYQCALKFNADPIIRITADCPLIDPKLSGEILEFFLSNNYDYVSNTINPTYPDGLDTEIFSFMALKEAANQAKLKSEREHVTSYIKNNSEKFKLYNYKNKQDYSKFRWTVDEKKDLEFVRKIYFEMSPKKIFSMNDILKIISENPKIQKINSHIMRNGGYIKSLKEDREFI